MFNTPILFLVFNRPDTTKQVFAKIREVKPKQLFVAADGAREHKEGEQAKVNEVRKLILDNIDWDCEVKTLFRDKNLGCGKAVSEAITWFFEHVEQGIILEDDCLPETSFFYFCEEMLEKYKNEEQTFSISGTNHLFDVFRDKNSYFFSNYNSIWGWATWKRVWKQYQYKIDFNPTLFNQSIDKKIKKYQIKIWIKDMIEATAQNKIDTWDAQWLYLFIMKDALSIVPYKNLVKNIGYQGTHTTNVKDKHIFFEMPTYPIEMSSLNIPPIIRVDEKAENICYENIIRYELREVRKAQIKSYISNLLPQKIKYLLKKTLGLL